MVKPTRRAEERLLDIEPNEVEGELGRSWRQYTSLSSRGAHEDLDEAEKRVLRVGAVSTELFLDNEKPKKVKGLINRYWQDLNEEKSSDDDVKDKLMDHFDVGGVEQYWSNLKEDKEGEELILEHSYQRAEALNIGPESKEQGHELWWSPHKTGRDYSTLCEISRNAILYEATGEKEFLELAQMLKNDNSIDAAFDNPKDFESEGQGHGGIVSKSYLQSVKAHDDKGLNGIQLMRASASKYYRATLIPHFTNQFDFNISNIASFAQLDQIPIKKEEEFLKWLGNINEDYEWRAVVNVLHPTYGLNN